MALNLSAETIVGMLAVAYDLRSFDLPFGACSDAEMQTVFERAVEILADRAADRIRRGLYRRYVRTVEDLFFDREPAGAKRGLVRLFGQDSYLRCSYRSELPGLEDNLILMWTLHAASRTPLHKPDLNRKVADGWRTLAGALAVTETNAETGLRRFYDRLAIDERPLHGLCRFVLEHTRLQSCANSGLPAFRLSMPALFAAYVVKWAEAALRSPATATVDYGIRIEPGFRARAEPAVVVAADGAKGPRRLICPVYDGARLTDPALRRIAARALARQARSAVLVFGAAPPRLAAEQDGVALQGVVFDPSGEPSMAGGAILQAVGCANDGTPLHRPESL